MAPKVQQIPEDQLDDDIKSMKSVDLITELKALKDKGVKTNVSGKLSVLKQLLHVARRDPAAATAATTPSAPGGADTPGGSTAVGTSSTLKRAGKPEDILLEADEVHAITKDCLDKLGEIKQTVTVKDTSDEEAGATALGTVLQPAAMLVNAVINAKETVSEVELNSSPALNYQSLSRSVRGTLRGPVHVHAALLSLFAVFEVNTVALAEGQIERAQLSQQELEEEEAAHASQENMDAFERDVQKRYEQDVQESSQPDSEGNGQPKESVTGGAQENSSPPSSESATTTLNEAELKREIALIEQALRFYLFDWMSSFPKPSVRNWPADFDKKEKNKVRSAIKDFVRDDEGIDLKIRQQPSGVVAKVVKAMLDQQDFPVDDAKKEAIIKPEFLSIARNAYNTHLKKEANKAKKAAAGEGGDDDDDDDSMSPEKMSPEKDAGKKRKSATPKSTTGLKGKKRARDEDDDGEDSGEDPDGGDGETGAGIGASRSKRPRVNEPAPSRYGDDGTECFTCFIHGQDCTLKQLDKGECTVCKNHSIWCRVLCEDCADLANIAGRGSGKAEALEVECMVCDFRR